MPALSLMWIPHTTAWLPVFWFTVIQGAVLIMFRVSCVVIFLLCPLKFPSVFVSHTYSTTVWNSCFLDICRLCFHLCVTARAWVDRTAAWTSTNIHSYKLNWSLQDAGIHCCLLPADCCSILDYLKLLKWVLDSWTWMVLYNCDLLKLYKHNMYEDVLIVERKKFRLEPRVNSVYKTTSCLVSKHVNLTTLYYCYPNTQLYTLYTLNCTLLIGSVTIPRLHLITAYSLSQRPKNQTNNLLLAYSAHKLYCHLFSIIHIL